MNIAIVYDSLTGKTAKAAEAMGKMMEEQGFTVVSKQYLKPTRPPYLKPISFVSGAGLRVCSSSGNTPQKGR